MSSQKALTIAIPTWNRATLLEELLIELIAQITSNKLENNIEVIISDNCSSDSTLDICKNLIQNFNFIKYFRNDINIGAKSNVIKVLYLSQSNYVLLIGDDDRIRDNCLTEILAYLNLHQDSSIIIDTSRARKEEIHPSSLSLNELLLKYYWYIGNAGHFICSTKYIKQIVEKYDYNFFNECWPQTQLMILEANLMDGKVYAVNLNIPTKSKHNEVMVYTSYYLWRTCVLELYNAAFTISHIIPEENYVSCRNYMKQNMKQVFLNILQCAVFLDSNAEKKRTRNHIIKNFTFFSFYEKFYLVVIIISLTLPKFIITPLSNILIWVTRGKKGIEKKNRFVDYEKLKRNKSLTKNKIIRMLEFEK